MQQKVSLARMHSPPRSYRWQATPDRGQTGSVDRRISEGKTPREATRALKRHLSRSLDKKLIIIPLT